MSTRSLLAAGLAAGAALLVVSCGGPAKPRPDLAFVTSRDGDYAIYAMNADGSRQTRLTRDDEGDGSSPERLFFQIDPAWSPDGRRIAFSSKRGGTFDIFVMDADGSETRRLTSTPEDDARPSWSPDGKRIAFERGDPGDVYVINADGSELHRVHDEPATEISPAWSPDGRWIAYARREPGTLIRELWLVRPDGTGSRQLTRLGGRSYEPAWSPDGKRIAFASDSGGSSWDIYTVSVDGTGVRRVTRSPGDEFEPAWSGDGKAIAFARDGSIIVIQGGREHELTTGQNDRSPVWRPAVG